MKNVLIVDDDLEFLYWLGEALIRAGYQPWPVCSVADAITVIGPKPTVPLHLLIANPSLPGTSHLIAQYRRSQAHLKAIALGSRGERVLPGITAWREKPAAGDRAAKEEWMRAIDRMSGGSQPCRAIGRTSPQYLKARAARQARRHQDWLKRTVRQFRNS